MLGDSTILHKREHECIINLTRMRQGGIEVLGPAPRMIRLHKPAPSVGEASRAGAKCGRALASVGDAAGRSQLVVKFVGVSGSLVAK